MSTAEKTHPGTWHDAGGGYHELKIGDDVIVGAYGPNTHGIMGSGWTRGWTFDPETGKKIPGTCVDPQTSTVKAWVEKTAPRAISAE